ncbi:MAG: PDDEXK nuclease domain-containing protein [Acetatifactor sp.]
MNELEKMNNTDIMSIFQKSDNILTDIQNIIETSQRQAYRAVDTILSQRNWLIGYRIAEEELRGEDRAEYGANVIKTLSSELTKVYGKGFTKTNLYSFYSFYKCFPEIFHSLSGKSHRVLSWTHYRCLIQVKDEKARKWYEKEAFEQTWSVRTLQRNINTQYYYRLLQSQQKNAVEQEMRQKTAALQNDKLEFIKNPVIAEFLGLSSNTDFTETDLEASVISNIQKFLMELGKGYAFVARQQHIKTEKEDYFIDLVCHHECLSGI